MCARARARASAKYSSARVMSVPPPSSCKRHPLFGPTRQRLRAHTGRLATTNCTRSSASLGASMKTMRGRRARIAERRWRCNRGVVVADRKPVKRLAEHHVGPCARGPRRARAAAPSEQQRPRAVSHPSKPRSNRRLVVVERLPHIAPLPRFLATRFRYSFRTFTSPRSFLTIDPTRFLLDVPGGTDDSAPELAGC